MMEASGKGNRMFAGKYTFRHYTWLILFGMFVCVSHLKARPQADEQYQQAGDGVAVSGDVVGVANAAGIDEQSEQLDQLLSKLANNPDDKALLEQLNTLLLDILQQANAMLDAGLFEQANQALSLIQSVNPGLPGYKAAMNRLEAEQDNALFYFRRALETDPESELADLGLAKVQRALIARAMDSARELDFDLAAEWLVEASAVRDDQSEIEEARIGVVNFKMEYSDELEQKVLDAMSSGNFGRADISIVDLIALGDQDLRVTSLREKLEEARFYGGFVPGQVINDELLRSGGNAPDIVIIAAGSFLMGSNDRSKDASGHEKPQHRVTIKHGFGLGVREVSVAEFRQFIENSGYQTTAERTGKSRIYDESAGRLSTRDGINWKHDYKGMKAKPDLPVVHVSLHDALAYVQWLSIETGKTYRLPSEAEYEYVARAGGKATYWWGKGSPKEAVENLTGEFDESPGRREWTTSFRNYGDGHWGPAPVGSLTHESYVHPMGVYDITGNVSEWTEDCWHQNYMKAPVDGSAWVNPGCKRRVTRGGYWASSPEQSRAAFRASVDATSRGPVVGIRIARDL
jgi:formylglycine-generating enzyme required for sulfatase activity